MMQIPYDYAAKGRADFEAGKKDERLYGGGDRHNADYRRGWQQARRDAEDADRLSGFEHAGQSPVAPVGQKLPTPPDDCPFATELTADLQPFKPVPPPTTAAQAFQPPPRPKDGGETATVRLVESPAKAAKSPAAQLDLFS